MDRTGVTVLCAVFTLIACAGCRRDQAPPIDEVPRIPDAGPLVVLTQSCVLDRDQIPRCGPLLVDPESGAAHRLTQVDAACDRVAGYTGGSDGGRQLQSLQWFSAWSPRTKLFYAQPYQTPEGP